MSQTTLKPNITSTIAKTSSTLDTLPKQFVTAMRTLFDIMDDKHTGFVNFADIEHRWQDDGTKGLPKGVIESLQKVTPANGMLSFERFCAGLKICLLRNQVEKNNKQRLTDTNNMINSNQPIRPPSAPLLDIDSPKSSAALYTNNGVIQTSQVRPNSNSTNMSQQRTLSMPQLVTERKENLQNDAENHKPYPEQKHPHQKQLYGPPKPPRVGLIDKSEIRTALQNWQMGLMNGDQHESKDKPHRTGGAYTASGANSTGAASSGPAANLVVARAGRGAGDGKPAAQNELQVAIGLYQKKANVRRREPRRHTLQNGIDYNMLKRMKQIEQEKDVLMQGLSAIEKARDWYLKQVAAVQDKMKYLGRMGSHMVCY